MKTRLRASDDQLMLAACVFIFAVLLALAIRGPRS
jgi:hypothetical protein